MAAPQKQSAQDGRSLTPLACTGCAASLRRGSIKPCAVWEILLAGTGYRQRFPTWMLRPLTAMALARVPTALGGKVTVKGALGVSVERARAE